MEINRRNISILCKMAYEGARDDAGRAFADEMAISYNAIWHEIENGARKEAAKQIAEKIDGAVASAKEEATTTNEEKDLALRDQIRQEVMQEMEARVRNATQAQETQAIAVMPIETPEKRINGKKPD